MRDLLVTGVLLIGLFAAAMTSAGQADDQPKPPDPVQPVPDSFTADTSQAAVDSVSDSLAPLVPDPSDTLTIEDSILMVFPDVILDTLNENQRKLIEFEARYELRKLETVVEPMTSVSFADTLRTWMISPRWNVREDIDRSFYRDAGDYFKFDPNYFIIDNQSTPMRKTVQPYGLSGDRLGFIIGGRVLSPFEHVVEPDGMTDLNDIPTALDNEVALLPGPVGMILGGRHAAATLYTMPAKPESTAPETSFLVDKGTYGYSYARGRYSKDFVSGRHIDMSIGYRNADGQIYGLGDDAYHYSGNVFWPIDQNKAVHADGWLYDRNGGYIVRPNSGGHALKRNRFDRYGRVSFVLQNDEHTSVYNFGYRHRRQSSNFDGKYKSRLNMTSHELYASREWLWGGGVVQAEIGGTYNEYDDRYKLHTRSTVGGSLIYARQFLPYRLALTLRNDYVESYRNLPAAAVMLTRETERLFWMASLGYSERPPSLNELHLRYQRASVYSVAYDYADQGNPNLESEKMLIGSAEVELGPVGTNAGLSVTAGKIFDGIDWVYGPSGYLTLFQPANGDVEFATVTADTRLSITDFLRFRGGASYHYLDYQNFDSKPYSPEYQAFSGLELHLFWESRRIDLWGYGEVVYAGPYDGYVVTGLGQEPVINVKLSAKMGAFRFQWISQNVLLNEYSVRDYSLQTGRYNSYGFTWFFLN